MQIFVLIQSDGFPSGSDSKDGKESAFNAGDLGLIPGSGISPRGEWLRTPVFLPGEFHGQRSLAGYSPWGRKESNTTETNTNRVMAKPLIVTPVTLKLHL